MATQAIKLVLIPGLGTDGRLFDPQRLAFPKLWIPPWIVPKNDERLADYATRMAEIIFSGDCPDPPRRMGLSPSVGKPFILGGVSLGGMIAYEMARHLKPQAVVLIASCRTLQGVNSFLRTAGHIWPVVPPGAIKIAKFVSIPALRMFGGMTPDQRSLCAKMFKETDSHFIRWAVSAILNWKPEPLEQTPVFQIHGGRDHIIPAKCVEADEIVPDGGHMLNLTHADAVNAFIKNVLANVQSK